MEAYQIRAISSGTLGGLGTGIVVATAFGVATGSITNVASILASPLTLVLTAIGFGLGLGSENPAQSAKA